MKKILPNKQYFVRRLGINKPQILHRIRLRKYIPQAPHADTFVRATERQKEDTLIVKDDMYGHTWDTDFGPCPFDAELKNCDQQEDTVEYEPTSQPEIYRLPAHYLKNSGGGAPEQLAVNDVKPQIIENTLQKMKNHEPTPNNSRNPENSQNSFAQNSPETRETNT